MVASQNITILTSTWNQTKVISFAVFLIIIDILAVLGNLLVIVVVLRTKELRRREANLFLLNLSTADLSIGLSILPVSIVTLVNPLFLNSYPTVKTFLGFGNFSFCICSIMSLTLLSLDRYFAIIYPYRYVELLTHKRVCFICMFSWLYSMLFSLPPMFGVGSYSCFIPNLDFCQRADWTSYKTATFAFLVLGLTYVLSLMAMGISYWKVFKVARHHSRQITAQLTLQSYQSDSNAQNCEPSINETKTPREQQKHTISME